MQLLVFLWRKNYISYDIDIDIGQAQHTPDAIAEVNLHVFAHQEQPRTANLPRTAAAAGNTESQPGTLG